MACQVPVAEVAGVPEEDQAPGEEDQHPGDHHGGASGAGSPAVTRKLPQSFSPSGPPTDPETRTHPQTNFWTHLSPCLRRATCFSSVQADLVCDVTPEPTGRRQRVSGWF